MDYNLTLKIRNAPFMRLMVSRGINNAAALHRESGVSKQQIGIILNLKESAFKSDGISMKKYVTDLADFFGVLPDELYPADHMRDPLHQNEFSSDVTKSQINMLTHSAQQDPERLLEIMQTESRDAFLDIIESGNLTGRESSVLIARFRDNKTLFDIASSMGVTPGRARQLVLNAIRKMQNPKKKQGILDAAGIYADSF